MELRQRRLQEEGFGLAALFRQPRRCSQCRMIGHDARNCVGAVAEVPPVLPLYHGKLSPNHAASSNCVNSVFDAKLLEIRGLHNNTRALFTKSCNIVMSIMQYYIKRADNTDVRLENVIIAFLYLPNSK